MKFVLFFAALILSPIFGAFIRSSPRYLRWVAFAIGLAPFLLTLSFFSFAPVAWPGWPGWPKGIELTVVDFLCLSVVFAMGAKSTFKSLIPWLLYLGAVVVSLPHAGQQIAGLFYVWQLLRMIIVFLAASQLVRVPGATEQMLHGVIAGVVFQIYFALTQYLHGSAQPGGGFGAQNLLGMMTNFALVPSIALLLVQRRPVWAIIGIGAGLLLDFLTASRATLAFAALGVTATLILSCAKGMTGKKGAALGVILLIGAVVGPLAIVSLNERRGTAEIEGSNEARDALKRAAWMIIADYPFGVGPDQYVVVANVGGYSQRAGVTWSSDTRATSVHNSYLLVFAETGLLGIITFLILVWSPVWTGIRAAFRYRRDNRSELLLGFSATLLAFAVHLFYEWAWVMFYTQYMFAMFGGSVAGLIAQLRYRERTAGA